MDSIFSKLNYKEGHPLYILNQPQTFENTLRTLSPGIEVFRSVNPTDRIDFILAFTTSKLELEKFAKSVNPCLKGDVVFWLAYPKGTSRKYKCDFNRDTSWEMLAPYDMMPVRQISIDDDWSALRFRKTEFIKNISRKSKKE
jgi:hypothetical protein